MVASRSLPICTVDLARFDWRLSERWTGVVAAASPTMRIRAWMDVRSSLMKAGSHSGCEEEKEQQGDESSVDNFSFSKSDRVGNAGRSDTSDRTPAVGVRCFFDRFRIGRGYYLLLPFVEEKPNSLLTQRLRGPRRNTVRSSYACLPRLYCAIP